MAGLKFKQRDGTTISSPSDGFVTVFVNQDGALALKDSAGQITSYGATGAGAPKSALVYIYQRAASTPRLPSATTTYTFATNTLTGLNNGWSSTIPVGTNPLYVAVATASSTETTATIGAAEWSTPVILAKNGVAGVTGLSSASVTLYQRTTTNVAPGVTTTGSATYTFATGDITGQPSGWTNAVPSSAGGGYLWVIRATAAASGATDTIANTEWSSPILLTQDGIGADGTPALSISVTKKSVVLNSYADGGVTDFSAAEGLLKVYYGATDVTASATLSATASGCTGTINTATNTPVSAQPMGYYRVTAMSADTATLTLSATYSGITLTEVFSLGKAKGGYEIVSALPSTNLFEGRVVYLTTDDKLYRYTGSAWTSAVPTTDLSGQITTSQITDAAITTAKFASSIEPVTTVSAVPGVKSTNTIFNTTDGKLYRWNGSSYVATVPTTDLSGTLTDAQLTAISASKVTGTLSDSQLAAISAAKITGQITGTQITDGAISVAKFASSIEPVTTVSSVPGTKSTNTIFNTTDGKLYRWNGTSYVATVPTTDLSGTLTDAQLTAISAAKVTGTLSDSQLSAISASKVTGTLSDTQLSAISAAKVTGQIVGTQITDGAISTAKIAAGAVTASQIAADTITAGNIAASAITASELAAGAVTAGKIAAGSIVAADIAAGTITGDRLAANTITASQIAASTITGSQIAADTITAGNIAAGAISASELAVGAVTAEKLTVTSRGDSVVLNPGFEEASSADSTLPANWTRNRVWGGNSSTAYRDTTQILTGSASLALIPGAGGSADTLADLVPVAEGEQWYVACKAKASGTNAGSSPGFYFRVRGGTIPSDISVELYPGFENVAVPTSWTKYEGIVTIPAGMRWAGPIFLNYATNTGAKINIDDVEFRKVVTSAVIGDGAITTNKIAAGSITAAKIASATITSSQIAADTITAANIAAGAITASELAAGSVTAGKIAAGSIVAADIAAGTITGDRLAANTITASQIAADTITAGQIAAGAISTSELAAGAVTSSKLLVVAPGAALNADPAFSDASAWTSYDGFPTFTTVTDGKVGNTVARSSSAGVTNWFYGIKFLPVDPSKTYRVRCWMRTVSGSGSIAYMGVGLFDSSGNNISGDGAMWFYAAFGATPGAGWTEYVGTFGAGTSKTFPSNGRTMSPLAILSYNGGTSIHEIQDLRIEEVLPATLIQDGAITTDKLTANSVTTAKIAANAITATQIAADAVTTNKIAAGSVTAAKMSVTQLDAITATIGTLRTATTGARTEISDNVIKVYDSSNVLRVKIGNLSL